MSKHLTLNILDIFTSKRISKVETMSGVSGKRKTQNELMREKLKTLVEKLKSGQSSYNNVLVMDTSGPQCEDLLH